MTRYMVVVDWETIFGFTTKVQAKMNEGWKPQGGVLFLTPTDSRHQFSSHGWAQAMIREDKT